MKKLLLLIVCLFCVPVSNAAEIYSDPVFTTFFSVPFGSASKSKPAYGFTFALENHENSFDMDLPGEAVASGPLMKFQVTGTDWNSAQINGIPLAVSPGYQSSRFEDIRVMTTEDKVMVVTLVALAIASTTVIIVTGGD